MAACTRRATTAASPARNPEPKRRPRQRAGGGAVWHLPENIQEKVTTRLAVSTSPLPPALPTSPQPPTRTPRALGGGAGELTGQCRVETPRVWQGVVGAALTSALAASASPAAPSTLALADEGLWDVFVKGVPRSATSYTISLDRLRPGVTYEFRVVAVNQMGYGEPSSPSAAVSGRAPPGTPASWGGAGAGPCRLQTLGAHTEQAVLGGSVVLAHRGPRVPAAPARPLMRRWDEGSRLPPPGSRMQLPCPEEPGPPSVQNHPAVPFVPAGAPLCPSSAVSNVGRVCFLWAAGQPAGRGPQL